MTASPHRKWQFACSQMRRVLYELAGLLTAYETTVFLLAEYTAANIPGHPEFTVADGIVELARNTTGARDERCLRVALRTGAGGVSVVA